MTSGAIPGQIAITAAAPVAQIRGAVKRYPGVLALDHVDFAITPGEVRALLGKNGAGKSTLIRLLTGAEKQDAGEVLIGGQPLVQPGQMRTREAASHGVRAVYQELSLVPGMSIAENLFLGEWPRRAGALDHAAMRARSEAVLDELGLRLDPRRNVGDLSPAERQMVEIARALLGAPRLVILDEPTSSLASAEVDRVCKAVSRLSARGIAVIYVSHRMGEIRRVADTVTVMRDGSIAADLPVAGASTDDIVRMMLGHDAHQDDLVKTARGGRVVLSVCDLVLRPKLAAVSFDLREGEVLGIAGLLGSGRTELLEVLAGLRPAESGRITLDGADLRAPSYRRMLRRGLGFTPESRKEDGIVPLLGVDENTVLPDLRRVGWMGVLSWTAIERSTREIVARLSIRAARTGTPIGLLSGGNQQKVVIGRWVYAGSRLLLLDEPTRGIDVEAKSQIYAIIRDLAREGRSIVFVSSEVEELGAVCDRVLVLRDGRFEEEFVAPAINADRLLAACIGEH